MSKSITDLLSDIDNMPAGLKDAIDRFETSVNTDTLAELIDKLAIIITDDKAEVIPSSDENIQGYKKKDILMAFGEMLMTVADVNPAGTPPKGMLLTKEVMSDLVLQKKCNAKDIIIIAASLIMNLVITQYIFGSGEKDGTTENS